MPPKNEFREPAIGELYIEMDGEKAPVGPVLSIEPVEFHVDDDFSMVPGFARAIEKIEFEGRLTMKRMSRKRLVKYFMAHGYGRNRAQEIAAAARKDGIPYCLVPFFAMTFLD